MASQFEDIIQSKNKESALEFVKMYRDGKLFENNLKPGDTFTMSINGTSPSDFNSPYALDNFDFLKCYKESVKYKSQAVRFHIDTLGAVAQRYDGAPFVKIGNGNVVFLPLAEIYEPKDRAGVYDRQPDTDRLTESFKKAFLDAGYLNSPETIDHSVIHFNVAHFVPVIEVIDGYTDIEGNGPMGLLVLARKVTEYRLLSDLGIPFEGDFETAEQKKLIEAGLDLIAEKPERLQDVAHLSDMAYASIFPEFKDRLLQLEGKREVENEVVYGLDRHELNYFFEGHEVLDGVKIANLNERFMINDFYHNRIHETPSDSLFNLDKPLAYDDFLKALPDILKKHELYKPNLEKYPESHGFDPEFFENGRLIPADALDKMLLDATSRGCKYRLEEVHTKAEVYDILSETIKFKFYDKVSDYPAMSKLQEDYIKKNFDKLSPNYQMYFKGMSISSLPVPKVVAGDALRQVVIRNQLKNYVRPRDIENFSTLQLERKLKEHQGMATLVQQENLHRLGIEKPELYSYKDAQKIIEDSLPNRRLQHEVEKLMPKAQAQLLSAKEACDVIYTNILDGVKNTSREAVSFVKAAAVKAGFTKKDESYTVGQWQKDVFKCPPTPLQKAYVDRFQLHDKVEELLRNEPKLYPMESQAVYAVVQRNNERLLADKQFSPPDLSQKAFLERFYGKNLPKLETWKDAQLLVAKCLYKEKLLGIDNAKYLVTHPNMSLGNGDISNSLAVLFDKNTSLNDIHKDYFREHVSKAVRLDMKAERLLAIELGGVMCENNLQNLARSCAFSYKVLNGSLKGAEENLAKTLAVRLDGMEDNETLNYNGKALGKQMLIASVITDILPSGVDDPKRSCSDNYVLAGKAIRGLDILKTQEKIKSEINSLLDGKRPPNNRQSDITD